MSIKNIKKIAWKISDADDYPRIYRMLTKLPGYRRVLKQLKKSYQIRFNSNNKEFETNKDHPDTYSSVDINNVKHDLVTIINNGLK